MWTLSDKMELRKKLGYEGLDPSEVDIIMQRIEQEGYFEFYEPGDERLIDDVFEEFV